MTDPNTLNAASSFYNYEFQRVEQPSRQLDPIINTEHHYSYSPEHTESEGNENRWNPPKDSIKLSSTNVIQQTLLSRPEDANWETVKKEVEMLKQQIVEKTEFYTKLKNKFVETEHSWQEEKKELIAEISLMKASKRKESEAEVERSTIQETDKDWEIRRLKESSLIRQTEWNSERNALINQLANLKTEIARNNALQRRQQEMAAVINRQNQQISHLSRDLFEHKKREELHVFNINRLSSEVEKLSLVHQKTNAMEQELQKLNLELGRWYQKQEITDHEHNFNTLAAEQNTKALQKRIYLLESSNYNLSEEIKRNREIISGQQKYEQVIASLKIQLAHQQIEKVSVIKQLELVKEELKKQKQRKERRARNKKKVQQTEQVQTGKGIVNQQFIPNPHHQHLILPNAQNLGSSRPYEQRIRFLKQETLELKNSLREYI